VPPLVFRQHRLRSHPRKGSRADLYSRTSRSCLARRPAQVVRSFPLHLFVECIHALLTCSPLLPSSASTDESSTETLLPLPTPSTGRSVRLRATDPPPELARLEEPTPTTGRTPTTTLLPKTPLTEPRLEVSLFFFLLICRPPFWKTRG
jgi:hypothetical protein